MIRLWRFKVFCAITAFLAVCILLNVLSNETSNVKTRFVPNDFKFPRNDIQPTEEKKSRIFPYSGAEKTRKLHNDDGMDLEINYKDFYQKDIGQPDLEYEEIGDTPVAGLDDDKENIVNDQNFIETTKYHDIHRKEETFVTPEKTSHRSSRLSKNMKPSKVSTNFKASSVISVLNSNGQILDCITTRVLGNTPLLIDTEEVIESNMKGLEDSEMRKKSFNYVYDTKAWGHSFDNSIVGLNVSGKGSSINWAQEVVAILHTVIPAVKIALNKSKVSILDIPCGDMQWMSRFLLTRDDIDYTGMDIVPDLIKRHNEQYKYYPWKFIESDLLTTNIQKYDIILNRMMLQHLFFKDIQDALFKFSSSGSHFLLTTTFPRHEKNKELHFEDNPGRFREVNLEIPPISLSPPLCIHNDGPSYDQGGRKHFMGLWELPLSKVKTCTDVVKTFVPFYRMPFYSCSGW